VTQILDDLLVLVLSIVGITVAFAVSLILDFVIILLLNWLFGSALAAGSIAGTIFSSIQYISYLGAGISYILMGLLLLGLFTKHFLSSFWETTKKDSKPLKSRIKQLLQDTIRVLIIALSLFLIFVILIFAIAGSLFLISRVLSPSILFVEAVKIVTAWIVVIAYVVFVALPLWQYGKDIFHKLFEKPDEQEDSKT